MCTIRFSFLFIVYSVECVCVVCSVSVLVCRSTEREVTEGSLVWPITCSLFVTRFFSYFLTLLSNLVFVCFHFCLFVFTFEGGVIFIDNNNNKFHIKTFRLVFSAFCFCFA